MPTWVSALPQRFPAMTWWDVLDIAIVAVVIYEVLRAIRGTRTVQMTVGLALLVMMFYISRWGHLQTVDWLIRNLLGYLVYDQRVAENWAGNFPYPAADTEAPLVSSDTWAEASKPVIVYWVSRNPSGST